MEISRNRNNFNQLAEEIASSFLSKKAELSLTDLTIKIASDKNMNADEIDRLSEKVNAVTTLKILAQPEGKDTEFDVVDPIKVKVASLGGVNKPVVSKVASYIPTRVPNFREVDVPLEKVASIDNMHTAELSEREKQKNYTDTKWELHRAKVNADSLGVKVAQYTNESELLIEKLASIFNAYKSPDFDAYANNIIEKHATDGIAIVQELAALCNKDVTNIAKGFFKEASSEIETYDDTTPMYKLTNDLVERLGFLKVAEDEITAAKNLVAQKQKELLEWAM